MREIYFKIKQNCELRVAFPTEDEMYEEMERKFKLGENHDDGMCTDDTQIG